MALFKKRDRASDTGENGYAPMPLLGDGTGSPWYAKGQAYRGDPMEDSTDRVEAAAEPSYEPVDEEPEEPEEPASASVSRDTGLH